MYSPFIPVAPHLTRTYLLLRSLLYLTAFCLGLWLVLAFLFPRFDYTFNFRTPQSSKNTLLSPHVADGSARVNGKISPDESLILHAGSVGDFSDSEISLVLEKRSALPESIAATLKKSYQAFRFPVGDPIDAFSREELFVMNDTYYALRSGTLFPFVSKAAFRSRYPDSFATPENPSLIDRYPVAESFIGFRPGSLIAFGDGVFVVTSETDIRPIGSAEIFLALGYDFKDVISASEEDLGIYKRGRIVLLGFIHPDGTLFEDTDTETLFVIDQGKKRSVTDMVYREFLRTKQSPILVSSSGSERQVQCSLVSTFFPRSYACPLSIDVLRSVPGSDLELTLSDPKTDIDINSLTLSLKTNATPDNVLGALSQVKERILRHFGYGN